jgi:GAF domain-containing protein
VSETPELPPRLPLTDELAGVFARMSGLLLSEETVDTSLGLLSALAQETVPGSSGAGVSIIDGRCRRSSGSTDLRVREADALQYELDQGPCLTATATRELVRIDDLAADRRWPQWASAVLPLGLQAAMSVPLVAGAASLGAIKVYADRPRAFRARDEQLLGLFSAQAAVLVANVQAHDRAERLSLGMWAAVHDRDLVQVAKGVLMGRGDLDEESALAVLLRRAEQDGRTVAEVALTVVDPTGRRRR